MGERIAKLEAKLEERDALLAAHLSMIESFKELQHNYSDGLARARETIKELEKMEQQATSIESGPLYQSEEDEDLEFLRDKGFLTEEAYREALGTSD